MNSLNEILKFRDERDWKQFHNPKDLAISIALESAELLELFQWKNAQEGLQNIERVKEELADVLIYSYLMVDACELDIDSIIAEKLKKNNEKYPVEKSKGTKKKYSEL